FIGLLPVLRDAAFVHAVVGDRARRGGSVAGEQFTGETRGQAWDWRRHGWGGRRRRLGGAGGVRLALLCRRLLHPLQLVLITLGPRLQVFAILLHHADERRNALLCLRPILLELVQQFAKHLLPLWVLERSLNARHDVVEVIQLLPQVWQVFG